MKITKTIIKRENQYIKNDKIYRKENKEVKRK